MSLTSTTTFFKHILVSFHPPSDWTARTGGILDYDFACWAGTMSCIPNRALPFLSNNFVSIYLGIRLLASVSRLYRTTQKTTGPTFVKSYPIIIVPVSISALKIKIKFFKSVKEILVFLVQKIKGGFRSCHMLEGCPPAR